MARCPVDTRYKMFLSESYNKETTARLKAYAQRQQGQQGPAKESTQTEVFRKKIEAAAPRPTEQLLAVKDHKKPANHHRRVAFSEDTLVKQANKLDKKLVDMVPASPATKAKLLDGVSKEEQGRYLYLQDRNQIDPEDKFPFPSTSNMGYGWGLSSDIKLPTYGRRDTLENEYSRTGIACIQDKY